jgi:hypothetical protein
VVLQFFENLDGGHVPEVHDEGVGSVGLEGFAVVQHNEQTVECYLYRFVVLSPQQVHVVADDVGFLVEAENEGRVSIMSEVREDVANLTADVVGVGLEQF